MPAVPAILFRAPSMKQAFLIFLMLLLPWQAFAAVERNVAHLVGGTAGLAQMVIHIVEHEGHVMHHHDDDHDDDASPTHVDDTQKSARHMADFEHCGGMAIMLPAFEHVSLAPAPRIAPAILADTYSNRTTIPPLRPPRLTA